MRSIGNLILSTLRSAGFNFRLNYYKTLPLSSVCCIMLITNRSYQSSLSDFLETQVNSFGVRPSSQAKIICGNGSSICKRKGKEYRNDEA